MQQGLAGRGGLSSHSTNRNSCERTCRCWSCADQEVASSAVDQDVQPPKAPHRLTHPPLAIVGLAHVALRLESGLEVSSLRPCCTPIPRQLPASQIDQNVQPPKAPLMASRTTTCSRRLCAPRPALIGKSRASRQRVLSTAATLAKAAACSGAREAC